MKPQFPLNNAVLMMALAVAYPLSAGAAVPAGVAQFAVGEVNVRHVDGKTNALVKGKDIESGQAIVTGSDGRAQVKFSDGGLISLQPNTEFKIANYVDQADPKQDRFLVDLLRGSMRAITGLIGKRNRDNYKVTTTTATIGIRGSGFNVGYNPDGSLGVTTELDAIEVCNAAGCIGLTAGESVLVVNSQSLPVRTNIRANIPTPRTVQEVVAAGNQVDRSGTSSTVTKTSVTPVQDTPAPIPIPIPGPTPTPTPPKTKLLTGIAFTSYGLTASGSQQPISINGALLIGDGTNSAQPIRYTSEFSPVGTGSLSDSGSGTVVASTGSLETGDYVVIGTWTGSDWVYPDGRTVNVGATAFVAGTPSPATALVSLNGLRASYSLKNFTPVLSALGGSGTLLASSKINVDFNGAGSYADVKLDVSMPAETYQLRGGISVNGVVFGGKLAVSSPGCAAGTAYCGFGIVTGGFSGANAQYAGLSFGVYNQSQGDFGGAATFSKTAEGPTPSNSSQPGLRTVVTDGSAMVTNYEYASLASYMTVNPTFYGEKLISLLETNIYDGATTTLQNNTNSSPGSHAALGVISDPDFVGWGNWVAGSKTHVPTSGSPSTTLLDSVHYIVGRPTPMEQMPTSGRANYTMVGGTAPTATLSQVTQTGQLVSAILSADFGTGTAIANVFTQFGAVPVTIKDQLASFTPGTANFSGGSSATSISGFFTGDQASRAGLVYSTYDNTLGQVTGAAAFNRTGYFAGTGTAN